MIDLQNVSECCKHNAMELETVMYCFTVYNTWEAYIESWLWFDGILLNLNPASSLVVTSESFQIYQIKSICI